MKAYPSQLGILTMAPVLMLVSNPAQAAIGKTQIAGVQIQPQEGGFELRLETVPGETPPQIFTANRGNEVVADILNAQLNLQETDFRQENPAPGIEVIAIAPLDERNVRIVVKGETDTPRAQVVRQEANGIAIAFASKATSPAIEPLPQQNSQQNLETQNRETAQLVETPQEATVPLEENSPLNTSLGQLQPTQPAPAPTQEPAAAPADPPQIAQAQPAPSNPTRQVPTLGTPGNPQPFPASQQNQDVLVPNPSIIINGNPVSQFPTPGAQIPNAQFPNNGTLAPPAQPLQPTAPAPPFLPRAVAPPVGDVAISNVNTAPSIIDLGTGLQVDSLVLKEAPVREVLSFLARSAGLNLVFAESVGQADAQPGAQALGTVSLDLENASVQDAFNYILQISGLEANRRDRTIIVGAALPQAARSLVAQSFRLNQVEAATAAAFLATHGASVQILEQQETDIIDPETQRIVRTEREPAQIRTLSAGAGEEGATGPLLLRGLSVSTDERLNILTMVGEPRKLEIAASLLTQLDARVRQVALNVKIVDVNLLGQDAINSSFSFNINDGFLAVDDGAIFYSYGPFNTPDLQTQTQTSLTSIPTVANPFAGSNTFLDLNNSTAIPGTAPGTVIINTITGTITRLDPSGALSFIDRIAGVSTDPFTTGITDFTLADDNIITINPGTPPTTSVTQGTLGTATSGLPDLFQFPRRFLANLQASIQSQNAKILSDPTLVVQEGQEATVKLTQEVVGNIRSERETTGQDTRTTVTAEIVEAGLSLTINVERIDDNGFITLSVAPRVASIGANEILDLGGGSSNQISLLNVREVSSGLLRLRDGQTLILAGIIQDAERTTISKVPLLGDIPILGALFRSTDKENERREVIVLLTPQILDDSDRFGGWGYNYNPGRATQDTLQRTGVRVPGGR